MPKKSFILVYSIILIAFFSVAVFGFSQIFLKEISSTQDVVMSEQAFYSAEAEVEAELFNASGDTINNFQLNLIQGRHFEIDLFSDNGIDITANTSNITQINFQSPDRTIIVDYKYWPNREGCNKIKEADPKSPGQFIISCQAESAEDYFLASEEEGDVRSGTITIPPDSGDISLATTLEGGGCNQGLYPEPANEGDVVRWFPVDDENDCNYVFDFSLDQNGSVEVTSVGGDFPYLKRIRHENEFPSEVTQALEVIYSTAPKSPF